MHLRSNSRFQTSRPPNPIVVEHKNQVAVIVIYRFGSLDRAMKGEIFR